MSAVKDKPLVYYPRKRYKEFNLVLCDLFKCISDTGESWARNDNASEESDTSLHFESHRIADYRLNKEWKVTYPSYNLLSRWRLRLQSEKCITHLDLDSTLPLDATAKALYVRLVCSLSELRILSLRNNQLTHHELTNHIGCLTHLIELQLATNLLTKLPYGLKFCRQLNVLGLENNQFVALPYFLREMPELHTVRRLGNNFNDSYINLRAAMESRLRPAQPSQHLRVLSLFQLAESTALSSGVLFGDPRPPLSDFLLEKVCGLSSLSNGCYPCDICHKTPLRSPLSLIIFPEMFVGIPMPPVCATVCDLPCARTANELSFEFSSVPPAALNVVGIGRRSTRSFQGNAERGNRRGRRNVSRLFCGCIQE